MKFMHEYFTVLDIHEAKIKMSYCLILPTYVFIHKKKEKILLLPC